MIGLASTIKDVFSDGLLGLAVLLVLASSVGVLVMRSVYQKLHFVAPAAIVAPVLVALAVLIQQGYSQNTTQTWLALLFVGHQRPRAGPRHRTSGSHPRAGGLAPGPGWSGPPRGGRAVMTGLGGSGWVGVVTPYTTPTGLMDALQVTLLVLVAAGATAVVLTRVPVRQVVVLSVYGVMLALLFLAFQAPDVTLSELTVGAVALPILLLLTLAKVRKQEQ